MFVGGFEKILACLTIYPFSDRFKQAQTVAPSPARKNGQSNFT
jgi:hypothetical protein